MLAADRLRKPDDPGDSDYSYFDHTPDGRVAVAYVRPDGSLAYTVTGR
ncbi:MAG TPA: hypothetical protein VJ874_03925 [Candidatus Thermoplasmatota archaeon]|nr:hypothetical protein [Candidatus Thermoplasmatota archaeon]